MSQEEDEAAAALQSRLKSALWFAVGKAVDEEALRMGVNATPQFIGALSEMVWAQIDDMVEKRQESNLAIETSSQDLESFAKHAGRKTISSEDVMLLTRRNEGLESLLRGYLDEMRPPAMTQKAGKRRER